jgi:acyl-CoA synthetase (AMP-forming)/AMP-acid ligase II
MILSRLKEIWKNANHPFLIKDDQMVYFRDLENIALDSISTFNPGDVVVVIGDFNPEGILTLLSLLEQRCVVVPLTEDTIPQHDYFIKESYAQFVVKGGSVIKVVSNNQRSHPLLDELRSRKHPGLVLFTTGTTGRPKAILHDFLPFIHRYATPRPALKALSFLLFDHIGGINTLLHMLYNRGTIVSLSTRSVESVLDTCVKHDIELLPTTPTFLRLLSLYPNLENRFPKSVKIISYGTERLDQPTLDNLCERLPDVDFRQTYGMSELGILRIKSLNRNSLFMKVGGEGVTTKVVDHILYILSENRMMGYLNADSPFDEEGWYCTKDIVEVRDDGYLRITGRDSDVINVGGLKFMPSEVERVCLQHPGIELAKAYGKPNPITGQHVEVDLQIAGDSFSVNDFKAYVATELPRYMQPQRIHLVNLKISHRFKKL